MLKPVIAGALLLIAAVACQSGFAQQPQAVVLNPAGRVVNATGTVRAVALDGSVRSLGRGDALFPGDVIETAADGGVQLRGVDGALLNLGCEARLVLAVYEYAGEPSDRVELFLGRGQLRMLLGAVQWQRYRLLTPLATLRAEGADIEVLVESESAEYFAVYDGHLSLGNSYGSLGLGINADVDFAAIAAAAAPRGLISYPSSLSNSASLNGQCAPDPPRQESTGEH